MIEGNLIHELRALRFDARPCVPTEGEIRESLLCGAEMAHETAKKTRGMTRLTAEEWGIIVR